MRHKSTNWRLPQQLMEIQAIRLPSTLRSSGMLTDRKNLSPRKENWIMKRDGHAFLPEFLGRTCEKSHIKGPVQALWVIPNN